MLCMLYILVLTSSLLGSFECKEKKATGVIETNNYTIKPGTRFLIYDVNPGEGFNLRRDVYIRAANLVKHLNNRGEDWILVLPPWRHLYHWRSHELEQTGTEWKAFFDIDKMSLYVPVMEFSDFAKYNGGPHIDHLFYLQRHPEGFSKGWRELIEVAECVEKQYHEDGEGFYSGYFWNIADAKAKKFDCVSVQGHATILADFVNKYKNARSVFFPRFEQVQHIEYGGDEFYRARRSLVFAENLRKEGDRYRAKYLSSNDKSDRTVYETDWRKQIPDSDGKALGGPYLGLHMRRGDFTYAHKETVPSIEEIADECNKILLKYKLKIIYLSTDGTDEEVGQLQSLVKAKVKRSPRSKDIVKKFKDGGVAIIDQWIVAHGRYFIGTCQSTFSFRIQEERDILGFNADTTFNCICGKQSPPERCEQPSRWRVKFPRDEL